MEEKTVEDFLLSLNSWYLHSISFPGMKLVLPFMLLGLLSWGCRLIERAVFKIAPGLYSEEYQKRSNHAGSSAIIIPILLIALILLVAIAKKA